MQTHSKKAKNSPTGAMTTEDAILAAVEPPPYGTTNAVRIIMYLIYDATRAPNDSTVHT